MKKLFIIILILLFNLSLFSETRENALKRLHPVWETLDSNIRFDAFEKRKSLIKNSPFSDIKFRNVGPISQGGRVMALAMDERQPSTWMVAYATGGVWITYNDGQTWKSIFNNESTFSIGELAVVWGEPGIPKTIWVGSGEPSNTRTVYMGTGLFKSDDVGKTWSNVGLKNSHHIGRIVINPENPNIIFVATLGPVYTKGGERGIFKSIDNGKTWANVLKTPDFTGAVDVLIDRFNPNIVFACTWERQRKAWDFRESGNGSGIWKSLDGGDTFSKLSGGIPNGTGLGRIGLVQSFQNPKKLYALVDNQNPRPYNKDNPKPLSIKSFLKMDVKDFLKLSDESINQFTGLYSFPHDFRAKKIRENYKKKKLKFENMKTHVNNLKDIPLYQPKCIGPELYVTNNSGLTWTKTHKKDLWDNVNWGYGTATYYFGHLSINPDNDEELIFCTVELLKTKDGGKTFVYATEKGFDVHSDPHVILYNSKNSRQVILGSDGGLNMSMDGGISWRPIKNIPVAQCYTVTFDMAKPYRIYTGLQDNGIKYGYAEEVKEYDQRDSWKRMWGADGMFIQVNPIDNNTIYLGTQFGAMSRLNLKTRESKRIRPEPKFPKEKPFRTNWVTPIVMSSFHPDIVYTGTQYVHRSFDKGDNWEIISPDLTSEGKEGSFVNTGGNVSYGNISALAESQKRFGLLYAGTDEGWLWVTKDSGLNWTRCKNDIPQNKWVTRVVPSHFNENVVYATFTGFRENDTQAYIYKSEDYGETWKSIQGNLPNECLNVVREDPVNPDLLYVGSDYGVYVSLDKGKSWNSIASVIPNVPAYDLCIHPRDMDLIIGTYGRSVWVGSIKMLQAYSSEIRKKAVHIFKIDEQKTQYWWEKEKPVQVGQQRKIQPISIYYHSLKQGTAEISILDSKEKVICSFEEQAKAGINRFEWNFLINKKARGKLPEGRRPFVLPGEYTLSIKIGKKSEKVPLIIKKEKERTYYR